MEDSYTGANTAELLSNVTTRWTIEFVRVLHIMRYMHTLLYADEINIKD